jgi:hypothetical protein
LDSTQKKGKDFRIFGIYGNDIRTNSMEKILDCTLEGRRQLGRLPERWTNQFE